LEAAGVEFIDEYGSEPGLGSEAAAEKRSTNPGA
jgi:hypothetical protein